MRGVPIVQATGRIGQACAPTVPVDAPIVPEDPVGPATAVPTAPTCGRIDRAIAPVRGRNALATDPVGRTVQIFALTVPATVPVRDPIAQAIGPARARTGRKPDPTVRKSVRRRQSPIGRRPGPTGRKSVRRKLGRIGRRLGPTVRKGARNSLGRTVHNSLVPTVHRDASNSPVLIGPMPATRIAPARASRISSAIAVEAEEETGTATAISDRARHSRSATVAQDNERSRIPAAFAQYDRLSCRHFADSSQHDVLQAGRLIDVSVTEAGAGREIQIDFLAMPRWRK